MIDILNMPCNGSDEKTFYFANPSFIIFIMSKKFTFTKNFIYKMNVNTFNESRILCN